MGIIESEKETDQDIVELLHDLEKDLEKFNKYINDSNSIELQDESSEIYKLLVKLDMKANELRKILESGQSNPEVIGDLKEIIREKLNLISKLKTNLNEMINIIEQHPSLQDYKKELFKDMENIFENVLDEVNRLLQLSKDD